jgi:hypothetical protein
MVMNLPVNVKPFKPNNVLNQIHVHALIIS